MAGLERLGMLQILQPWVDVISKSGFVDWLILKLRRDMQACSWSATAQWPPS